MPRLNPDFNTNIGPNPNPDSNLKQFSIYMSSYSKQLSKLLIRHLYSLGESNSYTDIKHTISNLATKSKLSTVTTLNVNLTLNLVLAQD
jgi:hypothetical protein